MNNDLDQPAEETDQEVRARIAEKYGQVWDTTELQNDFEVAGFGAPFVSVKRKADGIHGSLQFTHRPRFYFGFVESVK